MESELRCGGCWELKKVSAFSGTYSSSGKPICALCVTKLALCITRKVLREKCNNKTTQLIKDNPDEYLRRIIKRSRKGEE